MTHGRMRTLAATAALATAVAVVGLVPASASAAHGGRCPVPVFGPGATYRPSIDPASFSADVTNPWFPLVPGRTLVYSGVKDGERARDEFRATSRTRVIDGVRTRAVQDRLFLSGVLAERTTDYYAQDRCGNVWYFGEETAELDEQGHVVDTTGSWHAGVHGAQPGVFMQAHPQLGRRFRQEWLAGVAEDVFWAVSRHARVTVPFGTFRNALSTRETNALEPGVLDEKAYVRGIGEVLELSLRGPVESLRLVAVVGRS